MRDTKLFSVAKKCFRIIGIGLFTVFLILVGAFLYFDSDFYEARRLHSQIEQDLKIKLNKIPELIARQTYGWAEEGGDISLLKLNNSDCLLISKTMTSSSIVDQREEYWLLFSNNGVRPSEVKTWHKWYPNLDFTHYALDENSCYLFRRSHYE